MGIWNNCGSCKYYNEHKKTKIDGYEACYCEKKNKYVHEFETQGIGPCWTRKY